MDTLPAWAIQCGFEMIMVLARLEKSSSRCRSRVAAASAKKESQGLLPKGAGGNLFGIRVERDINEFNA